MYSKPLSSCARPIRTLSGQYVEVCGEITAPSQFEAQLAYAAPGDTCSPIGRQSGGRLGRGDQKRRSTFSGIAG